MQYGAPEGYHNDCVKALALAAWQLKQFPLPGVGAVFAKPDRKLKGNLFDNPLFYQKTENRMIEMQNTGLSVQTYANLLVLSQDRLHSRIYNMLKDDPSAREHNRLFSFPKYYRWSY